jgi:hypothetical protein
MYLLGAKAFFGVWLPEEWPSLRPFFSAASQWWVESRSLVAAGSVELAEAEPSRPRPVAP